MRTIGILGGMSAESTQLYYSELCKLTRARLGGLHSPELLIRSIDFTRIETLQMADRWEDAGRLLNEEARALAQGGAELLLLATNTMHKVAGQMLDGVDLPFVHIADATADAVVAAGCSSPGLMATRFTMEQTFYTDRLRARGLTPMVPGAADREETHRIIYDELCMGQILDASRMQYVDIAERLIVSGADALILGCTEVGLLLHRDNVRVPVFDTTRIHCEAALAAALA
ncbi:MAG: aspartate/glutamate racemase family protein [Pseudomonadota bacterium]